MEVLEGSPKSDALVEYKEGDRSLKDILGVLNKVNNNNNNKVYLFLCLHMS